MLNQKFQIFSFVDLQINVLDNPKKTFNYIPVLYSLKFIRHFVFILRLYWEKVDNILQNKKNRKNSSLAQIQERNVQ